MFPFLLYFFTPRLFRVSLECLIFKWRGQNDDLLQQLLCHLSINELRGQNYNLTHSSSSLSLSFMRLVFFLLLLWWSKTYFHQCFESWDAGRGRESGFQRSKELKMSFMKMCYKRKWLMSPVALANQTTVTAFIISTETLHPGLYGWNKEQCFWSVLIG